MHAFGFNEKEVTINRPFKGGFITRHYGNNPIPWIQIEMNRKLYLSEEYFDYNFLQMRGNHLEKLNGKFREALLHFYELMPQSDAMSGMTSENV
jgi:formiminoglutamase